MDKAVKACMCACYLGSSPPNPDLHMFYQVLSTDLYTLRLSNFPTALASCVAYSHFFIIFLSVYCMHNVCITCFLGKINIVRGLIRLRKDEKPQPNKARPS